LICTEDATNSSVGTKPTVNGNYYECAAGSALIYGVENSTCSSAICIYANKMMIDY